MTGAGAGLQPLWALLSQAYVAYTIDFDNEAEHRLQHRTTRHGKKNGGVWLVSMAMWRFGPAPTLSAGLSDGATSRRLPGRQLIQTDNADDD